MVIFLRGAPGLGACGDIGLPKFTKRIHAVWEAPAPKGTLRRSLLSATGRELDGTPPGTVLMVAGAKGGGREGAEFAPPLASAMLLKRV